MEELLEDVFSVRCLHLLCRRLNQTGKKLAASRARAENLVQMRAGKGAQREPIGGRARVISSAYFLLLNCFIYSTTLNMELACSQKRQWTSSTSQPRRQYCWWLHSPEDSTADGFTAQKIVLLMASQPRRQYCWWLHSPEDSTADGFTAQKIVWVICPDVRTAYGFSAKYTVMLMTSHPRRQYCWWLQRPEDSTVVGFTEQKLVLLMSSHTRI
jgi:hypothetical protein